MKRVLVKSVYDAFEYVMQHFYCFGQADMAERKDTYAVISIQDTHTQGFGFQFCENQFCKGVLTLYFDDIIREVDGAVLFTDEMADQIIAFVLAHRSVEMLGGNSKRYFETGSPNQYVYDVLETAWIRRQLGAF